MQTADICPLVMVILRVKSDMSKAFKKISGLKDVMPTEYGGHGGPVQSAIDSWSAEFKEFYSNGYPLASIQVDETKRPASARNYMKEYKDAEPTMMGNAGTFVKLDPGD
ncbi:unnamed protein product [Echinostoma caproni]|uniref:Transketolase n=1 Tax=Echinostoma caproni TaxID=27848 RepID=A0A183B2Z5_9TREM|nr:unnamed protein product [Echinostoma caproni]